MTLPCGRPFLLLEFDYRGISASVEQEVLKLLCWYPVRESTRFCFAKPLRAAAAAPLAKNSPQDCFLHARAFGSIPSRTKEKGAMSLS